MSLIGWMLRRSIGAAPITIGLFDGERELVADGYARVPVRWRLTDTTATTTVTFGPYGGPITYDRYVLFADGEPVEQYMETSPATLPRGFTWDWKPNVVLGRG